MWPADIAADTTAATRGSGSGYPYPSPRRVLLAVVALLRNDDCQPYDRRRQLPRCAVRSPRRRRALRWLRSKDPDLLVVKRSVRAAVVMPERLRPRPRGSRTHRSDCSRPFGSFALLLLVEFTGRPRARFVCYVGLYVVGSGFHRARHRGLDPQGGRGRHHGVVGFAVLFAGIVAPAAATASTAALLTFVLPVAVAEPASQVGPRLVGWTLAAAFCITACLLVWPPPWHDNLRRRLSAADLGRGPSGRRAGPRARRSRGRRAAVAAELARLRDAVLRRRPTRRRALRRARWRCPSSWAASNGSPGNTAMIGDEHWSTEPPPALAVTEKVAETLHQTAALDL